MAQRLHPESPIYFFPIHGIFLFNVACRLRLIRNRANFCCEDLRLSVSSSISCLIACFVWLIPSHCSRVFRVVKFVDIKESQWSIEKKVQLVTGYNSIVVFSLSPGVAGYVVSRVELGRGRAHGRGAGSRGDFLGLCCGVVQFWRRQGAEASRAPGQDPSVGEEPEDHLWRLLAERQQCLKTEGEDPYIFIFYIPSQFNTPILISSMGKAYH